MQQSRTCFTSDGVEGVMPHLSGRQAAGRRGWESNPYGPLGPQDFKSCASASSATPAVSLEKEEGRSGCATFSFTLLHSSFFTALRRRADSNRRIKVLQTSPLPLGYGARAKKKPRHLVGCWAAGPLERGSVCTAERIRCDYRTPPCPEGQSGKRDSNPRHQPWQGCALPTELFPHG